MHKETHPHLSLKNIYVRTLRLIKEKPEIVLPFLFVVLFELSGLLICFLSPRMPLRILLGPPIRTFWGERFLHYPFNFLLLPKLVSHVRMVSSVLVGSLVTAVVTLLVANTYKNGGLKLFPAFREGFKKYISLFVLVLLLSVTFYFLMKSVTITLARYFLAGHAKLLFISSRIWMGPLLLIMNFLIAGLLNSTLIYAIPFLMLENKKLLPAIALSAVMFVRNFFKTAFLVMFPMLLYVPIIVLNYKTNFLISEVVPESVLLVQAVGILLTSLVIDPLVTVSITTYFLGRSGAAATEGGVQR